MSVIEIQEAYKSYGIGGAETQVLKGVSLAVNQGEFIAITGPSGSGKTTLMNIIGLLDVVDRGAYFLDGVTIANAKDKELANLRLKHIGFVFQSFNLIAGLSARDNVELPLVYARVRRAARRQRATELLDMVGLGDRLNHKPNQLSGGQLQRVAIARALANQPSLILADEPTGNLDSASGQAIMQMLKQFNTHGTTVVMITHDPNLALQATRIVSIRDGMIGEIPHPQTGTATIAAQVAPASAATSQPLPPTAMPPIVQPAGRLPARQPVTSTVMSAPSTPQLAVKTQPAASNSQLWSQANSLEEARRGLSKPQRPARSIVEGSKKSVTVGGLSTIEAQPASAHQPHELAANQEIDLHSQIHSTALASRGAPKTIGW